MPTLFVKSKKTFYFFPNPAIGVFYSVECFSDNIDAPTSDIATDILLPIKVPKEKSA